jgi:hypothetical protein
MRTRFIEAWRAGYRPWGTEKRATKTLDHYVATFPTWQNAIDVVPGWNHAFPPAAGVTAGPGHMYEDSRISWCLEKMGTLHGKHVLELGPLEGMHTYMLSRAQPDKIDAIEANALAFLRCLVTKEVLALDKASFRLGDFNAWLEKSGVRYDLIVASGVLYHSSDPIRLLELIGSSSDCFYLWTHYFDSNAMGIDDDRRVPFSGRVEVRDYNGLRLELHERSYYAAWKDPKFCGGFQDRHYWMTKQDILRLANRIGFDTEIAHDEPEHVNGPSCSIFARRR